MEVCYGSLRLETSGMQLRKLKREECEEMVASERGFYYTLRVRPRERHFHLFFFSCRKSQPLTLAFAFEFMRFDDYLNWFKLQTGLFRFGTSERLIALVSIQWPKFIRLGPKTFLKRSKDGKNVNLLS